MEQDNLIHSMLELIDRPAFCVQGGVIVQANKAAQQRFLTVGSSIYDLLGSSASAYKDYTGGSLSVTLTIENVKLGAEVTRIGDLDIFSLESDDSGLRAIALAAQHLRGPLNSIMTVADQLCGDDTNYRSQLQRGLHRMHRMICNMSDSYRYQQDRAAHLETTDITSVFDECMEAIITHLASSGIKLTYAGLNKSVIGLADREMLERAVYNLVTNAVKFKSGDSALEAKLQYHGNQLSFSLQAVQDQSAATSRAFSSYQRQPGIEDSRHGIGLGLPLVRAVAAAHGGTVLLDHPEEQIFRVTMTISITTSATSKVRSTIQIPVSNYAGDRDRGLLELSEILPLDAYRDMD